MELSVSPTEEFSPLAHLNGAIERAACWIAEVWPLQSFISANPLKDQLSLKMEEAVNRGLNLYHEAVETLPNVEEVNGHMIKWLIPFADREQAILKMPGKEKGLYRAWKDLAIYDSKLHQKDRARRQILRLLPDDPEEAILSALDHLKITPEGWEHYLSLSLAALPGWSGWVKRQMATPHPKVTLNDLLALRLSIERLFHKKIASPNSSPSSLSFDTIKQQEKRFSTFLEGVVRFQPTPSPSPKAAQCLFCIDVRSEPLRKVLEETGEVETFGCAGFFGLPIHYHPIGSEEGHASCPAILEPSTCVKEIVRKGEERWGEKEEKKRGWKRELKERYFSLKHHFSTPFVLAEAAGPLAALSMTTKTFFRKKSSQISHKKTTTTLSLPQDLPKLVDGIAGLLQTIGLTKHFSPYVIVCGHGSETTNNPYASALQCGACGGHEGKGNAETFALLLNNQEVRKTLKEKGISIPESTRFIGAQHQTSTDEILFFDDSEEALWKKVKEKIESASKACGNKRHQGKGKEKSGDWSEVRPEWGLARNGALIIGPRYLTKQSDLDGRCFLQSYHPENDPEGKLLEGIFLGPLTVAHWINAQYLFSSLFPTLQGSGSKITHNVIGKFGVMQGNGSDLMHGLPLQSIFEDDQRLYHDPIRLTALVYAPLERVKSILSKHPSVYHLFSNGWAFLKVFDPNTQTYYHFSPERKWEKIDRIFMT